MYKRKKKKITKKTQRRPISIRFTVANEKIIFNENGVHKRSVYYDRNVYNNNIMFGRVTPSVVSSNTNVIIIIDNTSYAACILLLVSTSYPSGRALQYKADRTPVKQNGLEQTEAASS